MQTDTSQSDTQPGKAATPGAAITVSVNGEARATASATLAALVEEMGYGDAKIATALNGDFVPARARAATALKSGDHVEVVAPRQGG